MINSTRFSSYTPIQNPGLNQPQGKPIAPEGPMADAVFSSNGTAGGAVDLALDGKGRLWQKAFQGQWDLRGVINPQGQYLMANGQQGDMFVNRNPERQGLIDIPLTNQTHPFIQLLRRYQQQSAIAGTEASRLKNIFSAWGLTGNGIKVGILDPYDPLELEGVDLKTAQGEPGQAWSAGDHTKVISDLVNDQAVGIAPRTIVVDRGFVPTEDQTLKEDDNVNAAIYNMVRTTCILYDDATRQIYKNMRQKPDDPRILSMTWGGSPLTTLDSLRDAINQMEDNGEYSFKNTRNQILGLWGIGQTPQERNTLNQGSVEQDLALLNFISKTMQNPLIQQAHQRFIDATRQAAMRGQFIVVASGNEHNQGPDIQELGRRNPGLANHPEVRKLLNAAEFDMLAQSPYIISVAASNPNKTPGYRNDDFIAEFSSWGEAAGYHPTIAAPGQGVYIPRTYH